MFIKSISLSVVRVIVVILALTTLMFLPATRAQAVNLFMVTNTSDSGVGSLRQAMLDAISADAGPALIAFNIPTSDPRYGLNTPGVWTIRPLTALPTLTVGAITIDGKTQQTNQGDTNAGHPNVEIDGAQQCCLPAILTVESGYNIIQWLVINNGVNDGVEIIGNQNYSPSGKYIQYDHIGTDATGTIARPNSKGVEIGGGASSNFVMINCIAGNTLDAIAVVGNGTNDNRIYHNFIGICNGQKALPNGRHGILISGGPQGTFVGEDNSGLPTSGMGNSIVASSMDGISIWNANYNKFAYNGVGYSTMPNAGNGIAIEGSAMGNTLHDNLIMSNKSHGIWIAGSGTVSNSLRRNFIFKNALHGVAIYAGAESNYITGSDLATGNQIGGNGWSGVTIVNSNNNTVENNYIGVNHKPPAPDQGGNGYYGVAVVGGSNNTIGRGNVIAHNGSDGIQIDGATALHNRTTQNSIFSNGGKGIRNINGGNLQLDVPAVSQANCEALKGIAGADATVEIFSDSSDEGQFYEGTTVANWILFSWSGSFRGPNVTATATDSTGNTSEFSAPFTGACPKVYLPLVRK